MLAVKDIDVYYGAIHALKKISINVEQGSIVTLIGANGAGKSTTLKTISGLSRPKSGSITFKGEDITRVIPERIVDRGISQVPEGRRIFAAMSVMENLEMGAYLRKNKADINEDIEMVLPVFPV